MRITARNKLLAGMVAVAVVTAACGGDDDDAGDAGSGEPAASTSTEDASSAATTGTAATSDSSGSSATGDASTDSSTASGDAATSATSATGGEPIESGGLPHATGDQTTKIMVLTDVTQGAVAYSAPEAVPAVQVAMSGLPNVEVTVCDAKGDQNEFLNCQREAVDEGVQAVVVGWSYGAAGGQDILREAGIPALGSTSATAPLSYALTSGADYIGLGAGAAMAGCTDMGILHLEGSDTLADMIAAGGESQGATEVSRAAVPSNAPDLSPAIAKLLGDGANCILLSVSPPMVVQAMTAIDQSGETVMAAGVGAILSKQIIEALGPLSEGLVSVEPTLSAADDAPVLQELGAAMAEYDADALVTRESNLAFIAGHLLATAISRIDGEVTSEAIVAELDKVKDLDMGGIVPPLTVQELDNPLFTRYMSPWSIPYVIHDGKPVRMVDDFVDLRPAIEALPAQG